MAWRDGRASVSRLLLFMASIILGIAAVVSIQLFSENLKQNIQRQSKNLMGADFIIDSRQLPNERVQAIIDSLGAGAYEVNFSSMAAFPKSGAAKLVQVRGMEGNFPFYGRLETEPVAAADEYQAQGGALVDATLLLQYKLEAGDSIKLGIITLPIVGAINSMPGQSGFSSSVAPTVLIPFRFIAQTQLLQLGSRKEYQYFFRASDDMNLDLLEEELDPILDAEDADLDTHTTTSRQIGNSYENLGKFLNLAAFIALLLGCIGIASSVHIYIKEKLKDVAVLKCLGASRKQAFLIYLIQIALMGLIGGIVGTALGIGLQYALPKLLQEFLPFEVEISTAPQPIIMGLLLGVFMSVLFALLPLLGTWYVSPLEVLRVSEKPAVQSRKTRLFTFGTIFLFVLLFSIWIFKDVVFALAFVLGTFVTFAILAGISALFIKAIRKYFPASWGFTARTSLLNLFRPNNQTMVLVLAIGLGTFLISTLYFTKDILLAKTSLDTGSKNANIILVDVQPDQRDAVAASITPSGLEVIDNLSIVTMRMHSIKGQLANDIRKDTTSTVSEWVLNHEFRTTFRDSLIASETIIDGKWVEEVRPGEPVTISISESLAENAHVEVGDPIVFNVQGVLMETIVGSIRKVDWARLQLNFMVVFPEGVLEKAPQFHILTTYVPDDTRSAALQQDLVRKFPNVTVFDLRQIYTVIEDILQKISWVINFMAFQDFDFVDMKKKTSLKDIADKVGVSVATVSYVLSDDKKHKVSTEMAEKILKVAKEIDYNPNQIAKSLKSGKSYSIGLVVADISNPFFANMARIIEDEASKYQYTLLFCSSDENAAKSKKQLKFLMGRQVDGFIMVPTEGMEDQIEYMKDGNVPFVLLDRYFPNISCNSVSIDNYAAAHKAVSRLIQTGNEKIGIVAYSNSLIHMRDRVRGSLAALEEANLPINEKWVKEVSFSNTEEEVKNGIDEILLGEKPVSSIFFATCTLAIFGLKRIAHLGLKVPDDVAVVSFDQSVAFDFYYPPISYIHQPLNEMGKQAVKLLMELIEEPKKKEQKVFLNADLVIKGSCQAKIASEN